jgi:GNAT superfamily N-acetyltransferase
VDAFEVSGFQNKKISIFDMNTIIKMALYYHKDDPLFKEILTNRFKSVLYRLFGPLYFRLTLSGFKAVVNEKLAGYVLVKKRSSSIHIWDLVVDHEMRGKGIGRALMEGVEVDVKDTFQYVSLAVLEDNLPAMKLYNRLGYENLLFSPVCFWIANSKRREGTHLVKIESIYNKEAIRCRNEYFLNVLKTVIGQNDCELVTICYPLPVKPQKNLNYFQISTATHVGYLSTSESKGVTSMFLIIDSKFWNTTIEEKVISKTIEYGFSETPQLRICVLQAYERNVERLFRQLGYDSKRETPRIALIKKLE